MLIVRSKRDVVLCKLQTGLVSRRYTIVNPDGSKASVEGSDEAVGAVGHGSYGVVVRAVDPLGISRAIKLIFPQQFQRRDAQTEHFTDPYYHEIRLTNVRPFKHVVAIIDADHGTDADGRPFSFYVSQFVDGPNLEQFIREEVSGRESEIRDSRRIRDRVHDLILALIDDMLAAIIELQDARVVHMDIRPDNLIVLRTKSENAGPMVVSERRRDQLFVVDLGAAKYMSEDRRGPTQPQRTAYYFPEHLTASLLEGGSFLYERLAQYWTTIDLYSAGRTLEQMMLDRVRRAAPRYDQNEASRRHEQQKEALWRFVLGGDFEHLEGLVQGLLKAPESGLEASGARLAFRSVPLRTSHSILASATLTDQYAGIRIRSGHAFVRAAPPIDEFINHPTFQRLRRMYQLAFVSEVFPDATHNRFTHSLQAFELAKRFILALNRVPAFRLTCLKRDVDQILLAALLHDIGQYHFSHTIEDLKKLGDLTDDSLLQTIQHDEGLMDRTLRRQPDGGGPSMADLLESLDYSVDDICYMAKKSDRDMSRRDALNLGRDIVSGMIDVDRLSYLQLDSIRSGVAFGRAIDIDGLVEALTVRWQPEVSGDARIGLAIETGGVSMVEAVLCAVYWMYRNVYWRHTNRAFMAAVKFVFRHLLEARATTFNDYVDAMYGQTHWDALNYLSRTFDALIGEERAAFNPLDDLCHLRRLAHKRVYTLAFKDGTDDGDLYDRICMHVTRRREDVLLETLGHALPRNAQPKYGEILLDVPFKRRLRHARLATHQLETTTDAAPRQRLQVCCRHPLTRTVRDWVDIYEYSMLAGSLGAVEDHEGRKIRVFMARQLLKRVPESQYSQVDALIREVLEAESKKWEREDLNFSKSHSPGLPSS